MIRVLFIHPTLDVGGAERVRANMLPHLDPGRVEATVCCVRRRGALGDGLARRGARVISLDWDGGPADLRPVRALRDLIRDGRFDVVQTSLFSAGLQGRLAARLARAPVVIHEEHFCYRGSPRVMARILPNVLANAVTTRILAVSPVVKQAMRRWLRVPAAKIVTIPNPIDPQRLVAERPRDAVRAELGIDPGAPVVGYVSRMVRGKGHEDLLLAMKEVRAWLPEARLVLAGDGPLRPSLEALAARCRMEDHVRFLGAREHIAGVLAACDLFAMPSYTEGHPIALLEAMAMGLPVVAGDIPAMRAVVDGGVTGKLAPVGDPQALAHVLRGMLLNPEWRREMGAAARRSVVAAYAPELYARRLVNLWEELLAAAPRRRP